MHTELNKRLTLSISTEDWLECIKITLNKLDLGLLPLDEYKSIIFFLEKVPFDQLGKELNKELVKILSIKGLAFDSVSKVVSKALLIELESTLINFDNLDSNELVSKSLNNVLLMDVRLERLFSEVRKALLDQLVVNGVWTPEQTRVAICLIRQLSLNEYIWPKSDVEGSILVQLKALLSLELNNKKRSLQSNAGSLICLTMYFPLYDLAKEYDFCHCGIGDFPSVMSDVVEDELLNKIEEKKIALEIPNFSASKNGVSISVRAQYEENPYPKWKEFNFEPKQSLDNFLKKRNIDLSFSSKKKLDILVAGCGTGRQPNSMCAMFANAKITAIDISLASLAYGQRKANIYGHDIDFYHLDILNVDRLDKKFDFIVCSGVLHHMEDPLLGWKALKKVLKPRGLMHISLYSEIARRSISKARKSISEMDLARSPQAICDYRQYLLAHQTYSDI